MPIAASSFRLKTATCARCAATQPIRRRAATCATRHRNSTTTSKGATASQRALGVKVRSGALAQKKTRLAWTSEHVLGGYWHGAFDACDVALTMDKNPWQTNGFHAHALWPETSRMTQIES